MYKFLPELPRVSRYIDDIDKFIFWRDKDLARISPTYIGNDLEWGQNGQPTILGLSDGTATISVPWESGIARFRELVKEPGIRWVGHSFVSADLIILEKMGIHIPLESCEDTIIWMYLVNPNLAKASGKSALAEDEGEKRGRGFFNLGTMLSMYSDIWHYKDCRGDGCTGPCPKCDPFGYNGIDSLGPVLALPGLKRHAKLRRVDHLYPMHRELAYVLAQIQDYGIKIDVPYVDRLNEIFVAEKAALAETFSFNPQSPKAVVAHFKELGVVLKDAQETTVREMVEELEEGAPDDLVSLLDYKELGNGTNRWFERQYRDKNGWIQGYLDTDGYVHPRLNFFTSSGRLACSSPNFQNIAKRRISRKECICGAGIKDHPTATCGKFKGEYVGKKVRKAIIAPEGYYIVRADLSNAEGRTVLYHAGYRDVPADMHTWMVDNIGIKTDDPFSIALGSPRDAAKSVTHASNYLEGLQLKDRASLQSPRCKAEIAAGARVVFWDWTFKGKIVTFTGVNLATRFLGSKSLEHRKQALDIMTRYIDESFPDIRKFHRMVSKQVETEHCVRTLHGYVRPLYDPRPEDLIKNAVAIWGQQTTAQLNKLAIIDCWRKFKAGRPMRPVLGVHDELLCYVKDSVSSTEAMGWIKESMELSLPEMPGLIIPATPSYGPNWADQQE